MQRLSNSLSLKPSMTSEQVLQIMGNPVLRDFYNEIEEWTYCRTGTIGFSQDRFLALFFYENKLVALKNYSSSYKNYSSSYGVGDCKSFARTGTYQIPSVVTRIINRNK